MSSKKRRGDSVDGNNSKKDAETTNWSGTKRSRLDYNFWKKSTETNENEEEMEFLEIKDVVVGRVVKKIIPFRLSYKNTPRETRVGTILSFYGIDNSGEICFVNYERESNRIFEELKVNSIYIIENFVVEKENPMYPNNLSSQLQIKLNLYTELREIENNDIIHEIPFKFVPIDSITALVDCNKIDVFGIITKDHGVEKTERGSFMRKLAITDQSKGNIIATIWSAEAQNFSCELFSVVAIRNANLIDYDGRKKLNCLSGTLVWCNPELPIALNLSTWFRQNTKEEK